MDLKLESVSWRAFIYMFLWWGCLTHMGREPLPCRVGPLLPTENSETQRWARTGPAAVGSLVQSVAGPLLAPCHPKHGSDTAPTRNVGCQDTAAGLRKRGTGCLEVGSPLLSATHQSQAMSTCAHMRSSWCVSASGQGAKRDGSWVPLRSVVAGVGVLFSRPLECRVGTVHQPGPGAKEELLTLL